MIELNDDILNKYIDGDLSQELMKEVKEKLDESPDNMIRYKQLIWLNQKLKNIPSEELSPDFTTLTMMKIRRSLKFKRQQNFFIISVISLFSLIAFLITGFLLKEYIFSVGPSSYDLTENITYNLNYYTSLIKNYFSKMNVSIIGSVFSFVLLISGYIFYENLKHSKQN